MGDKGLAIDVFCGLGGWTEGLLSAGYRVVGFDNHRHEYALPEESPEATGHKHTKPVEKRGWTQGCAISLGMEGADQKPRTRIARYPAQLILQDALTIHGSQLKDAAVIVASPPCQNYSYLAMPWSRSTDPENSKAAKALRKKWETEGPDNRLFDACFRIQREAIEATREPCYTCGATGRCAGGEYPFGRCTECRGEGCGPARYIPLIVENVRGAVPWVGKRDMPLEEWNRLTQAEKIEIGRPQAVFGSFYLWGDVAQIGNRVIAGRDLADIKAGRGRFGMGVAPEKQIKGYGGTWFHNAETGQGNPNRDRSAAQKVPGFRFDGSGRSFQTASVEVTDGKKGTKPYPNRGWTAGTAISLGLENYGGVKVPGQIHGKEYAMCRTGAHGQTTLGVKVPTDGKGRRTDVGKGARFTSRDCGVERNSPEIPDSSAVKVGGDWFGNYAEMKQSGTISPTRTTGKNTNARKAASALIAKIPAALSRYIAEQHLPAELSKTARTG